LFWCFNANYFISQFEYWLLLMYTVFIFSLVFKSIRFSNYFNILSNDQYGHDQQDDSELATLFNQLEDYMTQKQPYLNPKLSLADLALALHVPENRLSQLFTRHLDSNYYQYINSYRLKEFERQLSKEQTQQYTIMALAEAAGFASKATFYKVFKAHYQMTPSQFIKQRAVQGGARSN
ncbi:MAG: helix-turn-helix domain-containing protein, partial [Bacteroidota bacterium]